MNSKRLLLTTTSSLDGWTVQDYLGPVSTEVVVGTGLFTDFFSSWTDFFGMESRSHQSKLDQIKERALAAIEYKALRLGATAVIGLRVDHDEIGAGGKSLLMVTAMGTAVRAYRSDQEVDPRAGSRAGAISSYELNVHRDRTRLLRRAEAGELNLGEPSVWDFVVDNKVVELAPYVLQYASSIHNRSVHDLNHRDREWAPLKELFFRISPQDASAHLYAALTRSEGEADFALQTIREGFLLDADRLIEMLGRGNPLLSLRAMQAVQADMPFYSPDDIGPLEALRRLIHTVVQPFPTTKKKGLMARRKSGRVPAETLSTHERGSAECAGGTGTDFPSGGSSLRMRSLCWTKKSTCCVTSSGSKDHCQPDSQIGRRRRRNCRKRMEIRGIGVASSRGSAVRRPGRRSRAAPLFSDQSDT